MEESKPVPCSEQYAQRFCFKTSHRSIHNTQSVSQIRFASRWIVDLGRRGSKTCSYYCLYPIFLEALLFFGMLFKIDCLSDFLPHKSTPHPLFTEPIFAVALVASPQKVSGLGWVMKRCYSEQMLRISRLHSSKVACDGLSMCQGWTTTDPLRL